MVVPKQFLNITLLPDTVAEPSAGSCKYHSKISSRK